MSKSRRNKSQATEAPLASWRIHHLANAGLRGVAAMGGIVLAIVGTVLVMGAGPLTWVLIGAFLWSLSDFVLPYHYTVTGSEVVARTPISEKRVPWRQIRGVSESSGGILLTPLRRRSLLDRFRGLFLHVAPEERDRVLECVRGLLSRRKGVRA